MKNIFILVLALFVSTANADVINAFTAEYDASQWEKTVNWNLAPSEEPVSFNDDNTELALVSSNDLTTDNAITDAIFGNAHADGIISFDWLYNTIDNPMSDYFGWLLNGQFTYLSDISDDAETRQLGSEAFAVKQGDIFGFRTVSTNSQFGSATTEISNFQFTASEVPEPSLMALFALVCIFIGLNRRKIAK